MSLVDINRLAAITQRSTRSGPTHIEGRPHFTVLIWVNMICLISGTGICWPLSHCVSLIIMWSRSSVAIPVAGAGGLLAVTWSASKHGQCWVIYNLLYSHIMTHITWSLYLTYHTHTLLSGNDRKRLLTVTNCFQCCGELKCHKTVCLTHNAYSFECPSHTQSLCDIIVRHTVLFWGQ